MGIHQLKGNKLKADKDFAKKWIHSLAGMEIKGVKTHKITMQFY